MALIQIENLSVAYGSPAHPVLSNVTLNIEEGEFVCLLGQTGCGKSTLLRLVRAGREQSRPATRSIGHNLAATALLNLATLHILLPARCGVQMPFETTVRWYYTDDST